jgi:hypothetical protein
MSKKSILHKVFLVRNMKVLAFISALSGYRTYSNILRSTMKLIDDNDYFFFTEGHFAKKVLLHMTENSYFLDF